MENVMKAALPNRIKKVGQFIVKHRPKVVFMHTKAYWSNFEKVIAEYKENNEIENGISINYLMSREIKVSLKDSIGFFIKMKLEKCIEIV